VKIDFSGQEIVIMTPASPLGRALLGKTTGESIVVTIGKKEKTYRIIEIL
jgi:transcription elongation GreA/GreB family factor